MRKFRLDPLRFQDPLEEAGFYDSFCLGHRKTMIGETILAGLIFYSFIYWDNIIDPVGSRNTAFLHVITTLLLWAAGFACLLPVLERHAEKIILATAIIAILVTTIIGLRLKHGFDHVAMPFLLDFMFYSAFIYCRLLYTVPFFLISWMLFTGGQFLGDDRPLDLVIANNICVIVAAFLGSVAAISREMEARTKFRAEQNLTASRKRIDDLVATFLTPYEVQRATDTSKPKQAINVAISYRRADADAMAGRIRDRLAGHFGIKSIFMDIDSIPYGVDFRKHIENSFFDIQLLLAVVGPNWIGAKADGSARIQDETDPVRAEIETAMGGNTIVIPVLIGGASMPPANVLPTSLQAFAYLNATLLEAGRDFNHHMERLIRCMDQSMANAPQHPSDHVDRQRVAMPQPNEAVRPIDEGGRGLMDRRAWQP